VPETATSGVPREVFSSALSFADGFAESHDDPIRILGPSFSGAVPSIRLALDEAFAAGLCQTAVRFVSGSASSSKVKERMDRPGGRAAPKVEFFTTSVTDTDLLSGLETFLGEMNPAWTHGRLALVREGNTGGAGRSVYSSPAPSPKARPLEDRYELLFPLHLSRVRVEAERQRATLPSEKSSAAVSLKLAESRM